MARANSRVNSAFITDVCRESEVRHEGCTMDASTFFVWASCFVRQRRGAVRQFHSFHQIMKTRAKKTDPV